MKKIFLFSVLSAITFAMVAQNQIPLDTFITKSGTIYKGELIENHPGDYFKFKTTENTELTVPYSSVASHFFYVPPVVVKDKAEKKIKPSSLINEALLSRRNTGIVLTSLGLGVLGGGIALMVANPSDAHKYSNSSGAGINFTGKGAVGFVMAFVSPALFISGAVIWAKASNRVKMQRKGNKPVKDL